MIKILGTNTKKPHFEMSHTEGDVSLGNEVVVSQTTAFESTIWIPLKWKCL